MRYKHDCNSCISLGVFGDYDLYFCNKVLKSVLARYGNKGHEYTSGLGSANYALKEAEKRAKEKKLIE